MQHQDTTKFYEWLRARLDPQGYAQMGPVQPLDVAFLKQGPFIGTHIIAAIDTSQASNTPTEMFQQTEKWFLKLLGTNGAGCLLFVFHGEPPPSALVEIGKIGGYMTAGAHDLHSGKHWLANHLNWEQDIYGK
jgi:hypothetical protein